MSYFHPIPTQEKLRNEALRDVETLLEEVHHKFSHLSLQSILVPEKKPFSNYPREPIVKEYFDQLLSRYSLVLFTAFLFLCWCNIFFINDVLYTNRSKSRLDLVRNIYLLYDNGVIVYKRKLDPIKWKSFCFCIGEDIYDAHRKKINIYYWNSSDIEESEPGIAYPENHKFMTFKLGNKFFHATREVFEIIKESKETYDSKNIV
eukprot:snap_masked-scaffold_47-processed-gene-0.26-mRNA-1 protein AED:1.00 eAED:1.00 QI:0/0/0/0/1/1/2/0/203